MGDFFAKLLSCTIIQWALSSFLPKGSDYVCCEKMVFFHVDIDKNIKYTFKIYYYINTNNTCACFIRQFMYGSTL